MLHKKDTLFLNLSCSSRVRAGPIWAHTGHMGPYGPLWAHMDPARALEERDKFMNTAASIAGTHYVATSALLAFRPLGPYPLLDLANQPRWGPEVSIRLMRFRSCIGLCIPGKLQGLLKPERVLSLDRCSCKVSRLRL